MKHDRESINAALALGDPALAPEGSVLQLNCFTYYVRGREGSWDDGMDSDCDGSVPWNMPPGPPRILVYVPPSAPPFEDWERGRER